MTVNATRISKLIGLMLFCPPPPPPPPPPRTVLSSVAHESAASSNAESIDCKDGVDGPACILGDDIVDVEGIGGGGAAIGAAATAKGLIGAKVLLLVAIVLDCRPAVCDEAKGLIGMPGTSINGTAVSDVSARRLVRSPSKPSVTMTHRNNESLASVNSRPKSVNVAFGSSRRSP